MANIACGTFESEVNNIGKNRILNQGKTNYDFVFERLFCRKVFNYKIGLASECGKDGVCHCLLDCLSNLGFKQFNEEIVHPAIKIKFSKHRRLKITDLAPPCNFKSGFD